MSDSELEEKVRLLEQEKAVASCTNVLTALRQFFIVMKSLVRLARTQTHDKAEEYSAVLDELKARQASLEAGHLQCLMLAVVGDPLRAKMAKEATSILKGVSRSQPSGSPDNHTHRRLLPYLVQCYSCHGSGPHSA